MHKSPKHRKGIRLIVIDGIVHCLCVVLLVFLSIYKHITIPEFIGLLILLVITGVGTMVFIFFTHAPDESKIIDEYE